MRKVKTSWDSQQRNRKLGTASLGSRRAIADLFVLFISKLAIVLIWNIQSLQGNRPVTPLKCTKSAHRGTGMIYDSCRFDIGRFRVEPTDLWKVSTSIGQICIYRSAHNNLFLTLRVIHKSEIWSWKPKKLPLQTRYEKQLMWPIVLCQLIKSWRYTWEMRRRKHV